MNYAGQKGCELQLLSELARVLCVVFVGPIAAFLPLIGFAQILRGLFEVLLTVRVFVRARGHLDTSLALHTHMQKTAQCSKTQTYKTAADLYGF